MEIDAMASLELAFADAVLFSVVERAQADAPAVGGFERGAAVGSATHMGALD